jgi:hypothetical protein
MVLLKCRGDINCMISYGRIITDNSRHQMAQYGNVAVGVVNKFLSSASPAKPDPRQDWENMANLLIDKSCSRDAFLGLCENGLVKGIPPEKYTQSTLNKSYAVASVNLLRNNSALSSSKLWKFVMLYLGIVTNKAHNNQMNVGLAHAPTELYAPLNKTSKRREAMSTTPLVFTNVAIECDISKESESTDFLAVLRQEGFDQLTVKVKLPKVFIEGRFPGSMADCEKRCRQLNNTCRVSPG